MIRGLTNWGLFTLPNPTRGPKGKTTHHAGHYFIMRFDSDAKTQHSLRRALGLEPRLLRFSVVKLGYKFKDTADVGGEPEETAGSVTTQEIEAAKNRDVEKSILRTRLDELAEARARKELLNETQDEGKIAPRPQIYSSWQKPGSTFGGTGSASERR